MNFKKIIPLVACTAFLASCNYNHTLWNQTFTYQEDVYFDIDSEIIRGTGKSRGYYITEEMKKGNINWAESGTKTDGGNWVNFSKHNSLDEIKSSTKSLAKETFDPNYKGFKLEISNKETKTVKVTFKNETKSFSAKAESSDDDPHTISFRDSNDSEWGQVSTLEIGAKWNNGKIACVDVLYDGTGNLKHSKMEFCITFNTPIPIEGGEYPTYSAIAWDVYAKIAN